MTKLSTVLDQVDNGTMLLPEFQRGYVWNRDQVRGLMKSMYRDYPVGALLVWETETAADQTRGAPLGGGSGQKHLLLDGQQRVTSLYGVIRGRAPGFFDGDENAFADLYFNVESEDFQFYAPMRMKNDPRWVDVTALFGQGTQAVFERLMGAGVDMSHISTYFARLQKLSNIVTRDFHVEQITGPDKTVDVVVDIFNRVNSGGTKLSKGDLALARICSEWDQARPWMRVYLDGWKARDYQFSLDWVLRNATAVATGRAPFSALENVSAPEFEAALKGAKAHIDHLLVTLQERLGVDHDRVLFGKSAFPVLTRVLSRRPNGRFADEREAHRALAWWIHAALRGRFTGPIETAMNKDLQIADAEGVDGLLAALTKAQKGSLAIRAEDFEGNGRGARSYPLLYLLTRTEGAVDLLTGRSFAGTTPTLHVHEIFPKAALIKAGYSRAEVNAIANFAFITQDTATRVDGRLPSDHLAECSPDGLAAQWIPTDRSLWSVERYPEFLRARQELLATAADRFLTELAAGQRSWERLPGIEVGGGTQGPREAQLKSLMEELAELGYSTPMIDVEVPDPETDRPLAVAEAFWPDGLQAGQGQPVVLELDPEEADLARLAELGCEVFTSVDALRAHIRRRNAIASGEQAHEGTVHATASGAVDVVAPEPETDPGEEPMTVEEIPAPAADAFDDAVLDLVEQCSSELRYNPRYFRVMISQHGALGATRKLLDAPAVSDGFVKLWEHDRLDLTAEALVLNPRFAKLFTERERDTASRRLEDFGYRKES